MQRMNPTDGHNLPYWWSALLGIFSVLSLQDYVFIIGALISPSSQSRRITQSARKSESDWMKRKRTQLLASYLADVSAKPGSDRPASAEVVTEALKRIASDTQG
jgi:hypothetical protein